MHQRKSLSYQSKDSSQRRDISPITSMSLYDVEGSKKRKRRMNFDFRIKNKKIDDEMKEVRNNKTKGEIKKVKELNNKGMDRKPKSSFKSLFI